MFAAQHCAALKSGEACLCMSSTKSQDTMSCCLLWCDGCAVKRVLHVSKAADVRHFLQGLLGEVQVVVWLDGQALPPLLTLQQPVKAHHIPLLLHMSSKLVVLVGGKEVSHVLGPVLIHLGSIPHVTQPHTATLTPFIVFISCSLQC